MLLKLNSKGSVKLFKDFPNNWWEKFSPREPNRVSLGPNGLMPGHVIVYDGHVGLFSCITLFEAIRLGINCAILLQSFPTINSGGSRECLGSQTVCQIAS